MTPNQIEESKTPWHSDELFRLIVESAIDYAIFTTDLERTITSWNVGAERMMGWKEFEILGQTADIIFAPEDRAKDGPATEANRALREGRAENKRWHIRKDQSRFWGVGQMCPLKNSNGEAVGFVKIFHDRTAELRATKEKDDNERRKDEFLAILAHELRNPLAAISSAVRLSMQPKVAPAQVEWTKSVISRQVKNLSVMIDDLLDVSRINSGKIHLKTELVNIGSIVSRAVDTAIPNIQEKAHKLNISIDPGPMQVNGDPTRLEQIVNNLLTNAAKYTDREGTIEISAFPHAQQVIVKVIDNGIGLSKEALNDVFELFSQVDKSLDRAKGGLGIGLAVVKKLVDLHGGTVYAESEGLGQGSQFTVALPAAQIQSNFEHTTPILLSRAESYPRRILIAEDSEDYAAGLANLLSLDGHQVRLAHDGIEALEIAEEFSPDVLIADIGLPGRNGYELASLLRQAPRFQNLVLIAVSGYAREQDRELSSAHGFDFHFPKPVSLDRLREAIGTARGSHSN